ncbi:NADP+-dependent D-mannitol dehydrogenase [Hymenopellis radicata]|nr:NADP+-dependent D-mannitol dehydrogenase [Hymenopellis radicata]
MKVIVYHEANQYTIAEQSVPSVADDQVLIKVIACGICGSDQHITDGSLPVAKFPITPGHEICGVVESIGSSVTLQDLKIGDRCVVDPIIQCDVCFYCRRGRPTLCLALGGVGVNVPGGFGQYIVVPFKQVFKISDKISYEEATFVEPTSCGVHVMDVLSLPTGSEALVIGAGGSGLILAQLLKLNGAATVVLAANKGVKMEVAREVGAATKYVDLDRNDPAPQWAQLKEEHPYGFDAVIDATGSAKIVEQAINYVRRGGTLVLYSMYTGNPLVHWPPSKIFSDEIRIIGTFAQANCFPRAIQYLESGRLCVKPMITHRYALEDFPKAQEELAKKGALHIVLLPNGSNDQQI